MRNFNRHIVRSKAVLIDHENKNHLLIIHDFSQMGVGVASPVLITPKSFITILYQNDTGYFIQMKDYVKHARHFNKGQFFLGLQFIGIEHKYRTA